MTGMIVALLTFAAWRDIATRTIPDAVSVALIVVGALIRLADGWGALGTSGMIAVALFLLLIPFHSRGLVGGADLKLLAALALGLPPLVSYQMIAAVTLCGGALAGLYLVLRLLVRILRTDPRPVGRHGFTPYRVAVIELWRIRKGAPLPYGVAIALGAALVIHQHSGV